MNRKRSGKVLSLVLSAALAVSLVFSGMPAAFADSGAADPIKVSSAAGGASAAKGGLTLNQIRNGSAGSAGTDGSAGSASAGSAADDPVGQASSGSAEKDPLEDTVVVLMANDSLTTKKKVRKTLSAGDDAVKDITIEEVWDFDGAAQDGSGSGIKLSSDDAAGQQAAGDDAVIALVSSDSMSASKLAKKLNKRSDVEIAEKNFKVHALSVSDDTYSDFQWSMQSRDNAPNVEYEWNNRATTGTDKIVAVVDTGVDYTHPDLKDNMWVNTHRQIKGEHGFDFIAGDPDPMDENGHGTHCAGIIGAIGNNRTGISGVSQKVKIMALRVLNADGSAWLSHEIAAYNYINRAIDLGEPVVAINNSWGGGEPSEIFAKLINIIGEKGAATVCAAGNEASNNDEEPKYPASIDSPYIISVGATDRSGALAIYSNYGESVDIAAPGSEILSTVPFDTYNPAIYGSRQARVSEDYNSFTNDSNKFCVPDKIYINGEECQKVFRTFYGKNGEEIKVEKEDEGFADGDARSLRITMKNVKVDDIVSFVTPYEVKSEAKSKPSFSMMARVDAPEKASDGYSNSLFFIADIAEDEKPDLDTLGETDLAGGVISGKATTWRHVWMSGNEDSEAGDRRRFVTAIYSAVNGDYTVLIDDAGISRQDIKEEKYEKYEYMSGTSMATPFISGTVALKEAEQEKQLGEGETVNIADVLNEIGAMAKTSPKIKTRSEGAFDFRLIPAVLPPRVGKVTVDTVSDTIKISGSGLYADKPGFKVEVGKDDKHMKEAEIIPANGASDGKDVLIKNEKWINNVENVRVTTGDGKTSAKKNVYLVNGKKEYEPKGGMSIELSGGAMCTDGKNLYTAWSMNGEIRRQDLTSGEESGDVVATIVSTDLFDIKKDPNEKYGMLFGKDLVYMNGLLYNVVEYGAADEMEEEEGIWVFSDRKNRDKTGAAEDDEDSEEGGSSSYDEGVDEFEGPYSIYSGEYKLVSIETDSDYSEENKVKDLGELPEELAELDDFTVAAYFGKLYFMGGSRGYGESKKYYRKVFVYDPATGEWSSGPSLPAPRAGGKALQYKDKLIYTLGEETAVKDDPEQDKDKDDYSAVLPANLIFDGTSWRACSADPIVKMYDVDELSVGLTAKGLLYAGAPVIDYGDTFIYDVAEDKFVDSGYNYLTDPEEYGPTAIACGSTLYGIADGELYTIPIESGFANVNVTKTGKGKVTGAGAHLPGNDAVVTIKASSGNVIKSIKVNGKAIKVSTGATKQVVTLPKLIGDATVDVVFAKAQTFKVTVKKTGKGKVTGAGKYAAGKNVKIKATANKGYYIKSFKIGSKNIKLSKKTTKKVYTIKNIKKATKVKVTFAKK